MRISKVVLLKGKQSACALWGLIFFSGTLPNNCLQGHARYFLLTGIYFTFSVKHHFVRFMLLSKLLSVKCKMDYWLIKIFQVYEHLKSIKYSYFSGMEL